MKTKITLKIATALLSLSTIIFQPSTAAAQNTVFTYQGRLTDSGSPADGSYDLTFAVWDAASGPSQLGSTLTNLNVRVSNGLFTVALDFGAGVFNGGERWLEIGVRTNGDTGGFAGLSPRQQITATPYAVRALTVNSNALASYADAVSFSNPANSFTGTFSGDGSSLSNVNVSTLGGLGASNFWQLGGNTGTTAGVNYLGTIDLQSLEFRVNNQRALLIGLASGGTPNLIGGYSGNSVGAGTEGAVIAGGGHASYANTIENNADYGVIGGGDTGTTLCPSPPTRRLAGATKTRVAMPPILAPSEADEATRPTHNTRPLRVADSTWPMGMTRPSEAAMQTMPRETIQRLAVAFRTIRWPITPPSPGAGSM